MQLELFKFDSQLCTIYR